MGAGWRETVKKALLPVFMTGVLGILVFAMYNTYGAYTHMLVEQQQRHLLLLTHAVSQNMELYLSEQFRQIRTLTQTPGFLDAMEAYGETGKADKIKEYVFSYMLSDQQGPSRIYLLDQDGTMIFRYNQYPFLEDFDDSSLHLSEYAVDGQSGIGAVFSISGTRYGVTLVNQVYGGNGHVGTVVSVISLDELYRQYVAPLNMSGTGYIEVKDETGTVIMHQNPELLGLNYERDIDGFEELPQYAEMKDMIRRQYSVEEGTAEYQGYYNGIQSPERKISAFSRMNLWGTSWYISAVVPYRQAVQEEFDNLRKLSLLEGMVIFVIMTGGVVIFVLVRNQQRLKREAGYLREINRTLEELNQSREEVRHYQKLTTIGTLAGGIAHEFNNLLTPILGYSEFLSEQMGKDSEFYGDIEEIYKAGRRAKEIVEQILLFGRKEQDNSEFRSMNLDVVIQDAVKMVRLVTPSNIRLTEDLQDEKACIYGNVTQIHQVLLNLYSNGIQSMEAAGGTLSIRTRRVVGRELPKEYREMAGGNYVEILVEDTGCGMKPEVLRQIFNPFFTTKGAAEGTGLGLAVVKDILINHGGLIHVESEPGKGSRFFLYIPVSVEQTPIQAVVEKNQKQAMEGLSVLLIDDEEHIVRYLRRRLEKKGFRVDGYSDAGEAMEEFWRQPGRWDAVVADYMMPSYKGTVLAQQMRQAQPGLGIVIITGFLESDAILMWKEGVVDSVLVKPVNFEELSEALEKAVLRRRGERIV